MAILMEINNPTYLVTLSCLNNSSSIEIPIYSGTTNTPGTLGAITYKTVVNSLEELLAPSTWATIVDNKKVYAVYAGMQVLNLDDNKIYILNDADYFKYMANLNYYIELFTLLDYLANPDLYDYYDTIDGSKLYVKKSIVYYTQNELQDGKNYKKVIENKGWIVSGSSSSSINSQWKELTQI